MKKTDEMIAGLSTFFTMAYILILAPQILAEGGWDFGATLTATILTLAGSTLFLAFYAHYPLVVGPGLSVATFLAFSVGGKVSWQEALGLVFWTGVIELALSVLRLRQKMLIAIPPILKRAAIAGLGLFFLVVGLKQLDVVRIGTGGYELGPLGTPGQLIGLGGFALFLFLNGKKIRVAFLLPILSCWALSLIFGLTRWQGLFSLPPALMPLQLDLSVILQPHLWSFFLAMLLIALFDAGATLTVLARMLGWLHVDGTMRNMNRVVIPDGAGSVLGSLLGASCCSYYAESSSGIQAGGRTWITACTVAVCSLCALFLFPAISSIPFFATAPALLGLGMLLSRELFHVRGEKWSEQVPFFVTALSMPFFFSIYWGFALGFISYAILNVYRWRKVHLLVWVLAAIFAAHGLMHWVGGQ